MRVVVVGASWGGTDALGILLGRWARGLRGRVVIVQHRSSDSPRGVLERFLASRCALPVLEPADKTPLRPATVFLAPPDYHLLVERGHLALSVDAPVTRARPS